MEMTVLFFSGHNYHFYRQPQMTGPFFLDSNYEKIGFGGNVMTKKKTYSCLAGYVFQRVQITTGKNYDRKKKKCTVVRPSLGNWKKLRSEKKVQSSLVVRWRAKHKTQHTS